VEREGKIKRANLVKVSDELSDEKSQGDRGDEAKKTERG